MAKEKKKVEKKAAGKTSAKKSTTASSSGFVVKNGEQVIKYFTLVPALPVAGKRGNWKLTDSKGVVVDSLNVGFDENPSALERSFERAILVVRMPDPIDGAPGVWRFALGGVATDHGDENPYNDIAVEIIDNGFTLLVYVQALENNEENAPFGFVASYTDSKTGAVSIYESVDPIIIVDRPPKP